MNRPFSLLPMLLLLLVACSSPPPALVVENERLPEETPSLPTTTPEAPRTSAERESTATTRPAPSATVGREATTTVTLTPSPTEESMVTPSPTEESSVTAEPTIELSEVDATQVANATATAEAGPTVTAEPPRPGAPPPLPTATDGRYPKPQVPGFIASIVADSAEHPIEHPTALAWDRTGALYIARMEGPIIRVAPDGTRTTFAENFEVPVGLAFQPGTSLLYVSHRGGITILQDKNGDGVADERRPFVTGMSCCYANLHQTNGLQFGPDGWLYFAQGSNSDHGEVEGEPWHAGILRVHPQRGQESLEYVATGLRNPYDLVIRRDGTIFATDNQADFGPPEELNHVIPGEDYGWPACVTARPGVVDLHPTWNDPARCEGTRAAIATFVPHASANGITAYEASQFPAEYQGNLFVALWSHIPDAYRIVRVQLVPEGESFTTTVTPFVTDFELPLAVAVGPEGALYIADWGPGRIYKVEYRP